MAKRHSCSITAFEACGIFPIAMPPVCRMLWVSAERPAAAEECRTSGDHRIGRLAVFDPIDDRLQEIEHGSGLSGFLRRLWQ